MKGLLRYALEEVGEKFVEETLKQLKLFVDNLDFQLKVSKLCNTFCCNDILRSQLIYFCCIM